MLYPKKIILIIQAPIYKLIIQGENNKIFIENSVKYLIINSPNNFIDARNEKASINFVYLNSIDNSIHLSEFIHCKIFESIYKTNNFNKNKNHKFLYGNTINNNNFYNFNNKFNRRNNNNNIELLNKKRKQRMYMRYEINNYKNYKINNTINQIEKGNEKLKQIFYQLKKQNEKLEDQYVEINENNKDLINQSLMQLNFYDNINKNNNNRNIERENINELNENYYNNELVNNNVIKFCEIDNYPNITKNNICIICMENFKSDDIIIIPTCGKHIFHKECLKYLIIKTGICPICKSEYNSNNNTLSNETFNDNTNISNIIESD